jgi:hypothetical protein
MKKYTKIEVLPGCSIEGAMQELSKHKNSYCEFNGHKLYSDKDDVNSAYIKVTGKTKKANDASLKKAHDRYVSEEKKHKEQIPDSTKKWTDRGEKVLDKKYIKLWKKCVPIRLSDLYNGMELGCCLDIVKELNKNCDLEKAKKIIEKQGHSGMSFSLVCSMVRSFCNRGKEFVEYVK